MWPTLDRATSSAATSPSLSSSPTSSSSRPPRLLVLCSDDELRTALGFRLAYEVAARGEHAVFICHSHKFERAFPLPLAVQPEGATCWDPATLSRVAIKYVKNAAELQRVGALLHTMQPTPHCVVVDHLAFIVDPLTVTARTDSTFLDACLKSAALIASACDHFDALPRMCVRPPCRLVITANCFEPQFQAALRRGMHLVHVRYGPQLHGKSSSSSTSSGAAIEVCLRAVDGNKEVKLFQCAKTADPTAPAGQHASLFQVHALYALQQQ